MNVPKSLHFEELNFSSTSIFQKLILLNQANLSLILSNFTLWSRKNTMLAKHNSNVDVDQIKPML